MSDEKKVAPDCVHVPLSYPVTVNGVEYADLVIRRPKGRDRLAASKVVGELERDYAFLATLCDVPVEVFSEMDGADIDRVSEKVAGFK